MLEHFGRGRQFCLHPSLGMQQLRQSSAITWASCSPLLPVCFQGPRHSAPLFSEGASECLQKLELRQLFSLVDPAEDHLPGKESAGGHGDEESPWGRSAHSSAGCVLPSWVAIWSCLLHSAQHGSGPCAAHKIPDTAEGCELRLRWLKVLFCHCTWFSYCGLALMKMVKMPKISLEMKPQGLDFAEGWSIFKSKMRLLAPGQHKLPWQPASTHFYGVY